MVKQPRAYDKVFYHIVRGRNADLTRRTVGTLTR